VTASDAPHIHVQRMLDEIHEHYADRLNLGTLARTLGRQAAYLGRLFRQEVGATVHDYVTRLRLERSASEVSSGVKIEAVALCIGYRSKKNFYRQFKRHFGCTPEQYRHGRRAVGASQSGNPRSHAAESAPAASVASVPARAVAGPRTVATTHRAYRRPRYAALKLTLLAQELVLKSVVPSPLAMLLSDPAGRYVGANRAAASMTGYSLADLRQMPVDSLLETEERPLEGAPLLQILMTPSDHFRANAVLHTKTAGVVGVHCISGRNPMWNRGGSASTMAESLSRA
jgi:AraC-like DNA-binding protein